MPDAGSAHAGAIGALMAADVMPGYTDGAVRPDRPITRGQLATLTVLLREHLQPDTN